MASTYLAFFVNFRPVEICPKKVVKTHQNLKITAPYYLRAINHPCRTPSAQKNHFLWRGKIFGAVGAPGVKITFFKAAGSEIGTIITCKGPNNPEIHIYP